MKPSVILMGAASLVLLTAPKGGGCNGQGGSGGASGCSQGGASTGGTATGGTATGGTATGGTATGGTATGGTAMGGTAMGGTTSQGGTTGGTATGGTGGSSQGAHDFVILQTTSGGPGCPGPATVEASYDTRGRMLTLSFPSFELEHHPGSGFAHTSCVTGLTIKGAPGWQFAATGASVHGVAGLPAGTSARVKTTVFFAGSPDSSELTSTLDGPSQGPVHLDDDFPPATILRAPCGQDVIYNIQVSITMDTGAQDSAAIGISSVDLPIVWSGC